MRRFLYGLGLISYTVGFVGYAWTISIKWLAVVVTSVAVMLMAHQHSR